MNAITMLVLLRLPGTDSLERCVPGARGIIVGDDNPENPASRLHHWLSCFRAAYNAPLTGLAALASGRLSTLLGCGSREPFGAATLDCLFPVPRHAGFDGDNHDRA